METDSQHANNLSKSARMSVCVYQICKFLSVRGCDLSQMITVLTHRLHVIGRLTPFNCKIIADRFYLIAILSPS